MVWFAGWLWQGVALTLLTALILHTSRAVNAATRYALEKLIATDRVAMHGGLGARNTTYSLAEED